MTPHTSAYTRRGAARAGVVLSLTSLLLAACGGSVSTGGGGAGGSGAAGAAGAAGSGGTATTDKFPCVDPQPLRVGGQDTGYDTCRGGFLRRRKAVECPDLLPTSGSCTGGGYCTTDADCTARPYGHCAIGAGFVCQCTYGCRSDADCDAGSICLCADPIGTCVKAGCRSDASCGGLLCTSYAMDAAECNARGFACQTAGDECASQSDCTGDVCGYSGSRHVCKSVLCSM